MGVGVAEYLGQRTDCDTVTISPADPHAECPFMNYRCDKLARGNKPVCSVRKPDGTLWIVCEHRLCATKRAQNKPLKQYQADRLLEIAKKIFHSDVSMDNVLVKREVQMTVNEETDYKADYIMTLINGRSPYPGPDRLVLEMQGGGETNQTGKITDLIKRWETNPNRTNAFLRQEVQGTGTIETNAWRRQQEQFIVKGNIAALTWKGYGIAFCVGASLFDYIWQKVKDDRLPSLRNHNWTLALICFEEDVSNPPTFGPVPLKIDETRLYFTNYQTFVHALINQGEPTSDAFAGEFINLQGKSVQVPKDGI